jgi:glycosyltransferase involved in cell wall biosynthesis
MRILIITQKYDLNDANLGAFNVWWQKLAEKLDYVYILALEKKSEPPRKNMKVFSMGKEKGSARLAMLFRFFRTLLLVLPRTKIVFVHMIPLYLILAWFPAKFFRNKLVMWYAGVTMNNWVRLAVWLSNKSLTSQEGALRMKSKKRIIIGHGIDVDKFVPVAHLPQEDKISQKTTILSVGRITPSKGHDLVIRSVADLVKAGYDLNLKIIGGVVQDYHQKYQDDLKALAAKCGISDRVEFTGAVNYNEMPQYYNEAEILVDAVPVGGFDKVVLEAMTSGVIPLTSNRYVGSVFSEELKNVLIFKEGDGIDLVQKLKTILDQKLWLNEVIKTELRSIVIEKYNLNKFIDKLINVFNELVSKKN